MKCGPGDDQIRCQVERESGVQMGQAKQGRAAKASLEREKWVKVNPCVTLSGAVRYSDGIPDGRQALVWR